MPLLILASPSPTIHSCWTFCMASTSASSSCLSSSLHRSLEGIVWQQPWPALSWWAWPRRFAMVAHQAVRSGPPSTRGSGPFTCGPSPPPVVLTVHHLVPAHLRLNIKLWWPACLHHTTFCLQPLGRTSRRPLLHGHHGIPSPSPTPSVSSPSPRHRAPRTGLSTQMPLLTLPPTLVWLPCHHPPLFLPPLL